MFSIKDWEDIKSEIERDYGRVSSEREEKSGLLNSSVLDENYEVSPQDLIGSIQSAMSRLGVIEEAKVEMLGLNQSYEELSSKLEKIGQFDPIVEAIASRFEVILKDIEVVELKIDQNITEQNSVAELRLPKTLDTLKEEFGADVRGMLEKLIDLNSELGEFYSKDMLEFLAKYKSVKGSPLKFARFFAGEDMKGFIDDSFVMFVEVNDEVESVDELNEKLLDLISEKIELQSKYASIIKEL